MTLWCNALLYPVLFDIYVLLQCILPLFQNVSDCPSYPTERYTDDVDGVQVVACMCFQTKTQVPCTLDVLSTYCNNSASSCLSSCFTPLAITSNHLSHTNGATVSNKKLHWHKT